MTEAIVDSLDFRNAMARFASGVTIVTTRDAEGELQGFTASAFSSLSLDPPLVLVCLEKRAHSYAGFMAATHMAISVLATDHGDLAWHFAKKHEDKFAGVEMVTGQVTSLPLVPDATVHLECRVYDRLDGGDHTIILGQVLHAESTDREPLLHFNRQFGRFVPDDVG